MRDVTLAAAWLLLACMSAAAEEPFPRQAEIATWRIQIAPADLQFLIDHPESEEYKACTLIVAAVSYPGQMRVRGNSSRLWPKKSWKVKLNSGVSMNGRKKFYLSGMASHPSPWCDTLAYAMARAAGVVAPRCQYFELAINDAPWGLYLDQEDVSDKQALRDRGFHADSNVYRGYPQSFSDWDPARVEWEKVTNEESPYTDIEECIHAVARTPQHRFLETLPRYFDVDELINLLAWHTILGMGVISDAAYYYIHDATTDRWHTVPHDANNGRWWSIWRTNPTLVPYTDYENYRGMDERYDMWNGLWTRMLDVPSCRERLIRRIQDLYATVLTDAVLQGYLTYLRGLTLPAVLRDPFLGGETYDAEFNSHMSDIVRRHQYVLASLDRLRTMDDEGVRINEFLANNGGAVRDEFGEADPFIEVVNATDRDASLAGCMLAVRRMPVGWSELTPFDAWTIPAGVTVPAGRRIVLWMDGQPGQGPLHATKRLDPERGEILLIRPVAFGQWPSEPHGVIDQIFYGSQTADRSYGRMPDGSESWGEGLIPTPGAPNGTEREVTAGLGQGGQDHLYTWRTATQDPPAPQLYPLAWAPYDTTVGETHPAYGDVDGDGLDEMVVGFGSFPSNGGWVQVRDDAEHGGALLAWIRLPNATYNAANGATFPCCGDTDGDGRAEIAVGLGRGGRGVWYVFDDALDSYALRATREVPWEEYDTGPGGGETRLALGDIDLDGRAEPVIGLGPGGQGRWCTFSDAFSDYQFRTWNEVQWPDYNANRAGTTRPAVGDIDQDGIAEVIIGLEQGGECRLEVFDDALHGHAHMEWVQVGEEPYRSTVGATRPSLGDMDADGDADLAVGFGRGGQGSVEVWRRSTSQGRYVAWWTRQVPGPGGYASANGEAWPAFGNRRWSR